MISVLYRKGIFLMLLVALYQAIMMAMVKAVGDHVSTGLAVLLYYLLPLVLFSLTLFKEGIAGYWPQDFRSIFQYMLRGMFASGSLICFFFSITKIDLGIASIMFNSAPLFVVLFSAFFLKEKSNLSVYAGSIVAFAGICLIIMPAGDLKGLIDIYAVLALGSAVLMSLAIIYMKKFVNQKKSTNQIVFYLYLFATLFTGLFLFLESQLLNKPIITITKVDKNLWVIPTLIMFGVMSLISQKTITKAFSYMPANLASPILFISVLLSSIFGYLFWGQLISPITIIGIVITIIGVTAVIFFQNFRSDNGKEISG